MSTAEMLFEKAKHLPENLQAEALDYVDCLLTRCGAHGVRALPAVTGALLPRAKNMR
jgi:hypothetical protein